MSRPIDALNVLCVQLTRDLFAIAKFLLLTDMATLQRMSDKRSGGGVISPRTDLDLYA